jgi:hypothetical protein
MPKLSRHGRELLRLEYPSHRRVYFQTGVIFANRGGSWAIAGKLRVRRLSWPDHQTRRFSPFQPLQRVARAALASEGREPVADSSTGPRGGFLCVLSQTQTLGVQ